jgi:hypothetical protein
MQFDQQSSWFKYLGPLQADLVKTSFYLSEQFVENHYINDYSFIVFPMAKAYEGFLKKVLLDLNLITHKVYYGRRFRIGRALNPDVRPNQRDKWWLYDDLSRIFNQELAREIWQTWLECRNHVFHFFPNGEQTLNMDEAKSCLNKMQVVMETTINLLEKRRQDKINRKKI